MTVKQLKKIISNLPDKMPVMLLDLTTDVPEDSSYTLEVSSIGVDDYVTMEDEEVKGQALWISFRNKLNESAI